MPSTKWKILIVSIVLYQALLTWAMFALINTAAYFSRIECGEWCSDRLFGFILTNQGAYDDANTLVWLTLVIVAVNAGVWIAAWRADRRVARTEAANHALNSKPALPTVD
jgi:hypothetical protein